MRDTLEDKENAALIIMDNFRGQITPAINSLLEDNNIHVCLIPPNTTDLLQPLDISINKPAKEFLKRKFEQWYSERVLEQVEGQDIDNVEIEPINLSFPVMKELGARWMVETAEYISENPQFMINGFIKAGITRALDGVEEEAVKMDEDGEDSEEDIEYEDDEPEVIVLA